MRTGNWLADQPLQAVERKQRARGRHQRGEAVPPTGRIGLGRGSTDPQAGSASTATPSKSRMNPPHQGFIMRPSRICARGEDQPQRRCPPPLGFLPAGLGLCWAPGCASLRGFAPTGRTASRCGWTGRSARSPRSPRGGHCDPAAGRGASRSGGHHRAAGCGPGVPRCAGRGSGRHVLQRPAG